MAAPDRPAGRGDRLALAIATVGGIGYVPFAPGTFGSLPGLAAAWAAQAWLGPWSAVPLAAVLAAVGIAVSGRAARALGRPDPGPVVIDETAGQVLALAGAPASAAAYAAGFVLFRAFDIIKPPPARRLERLSGGLGIVADDLAAGVYAAIVLHVAMYVAPWLRGT